MSIEISPHSERQGDRRADLSQVPNGAGEHRIELNWIGNGAWRACDPTVPADDARCLVAYVECTDHHVEVMWIGSRRRTSTYQSLRAAYAALNQSLE